MKIVSVEEARGAGDVPRAPAYYYGELLRGDSPPASSELGVRCEELQANVAVRASPPRCDRQQSLPDHSPPENPQKHQEETYSTAGTFPMPEPKEKEPLLAELEIVGRVPLTQLDGGSGVRRSRSWYLCCPNIDEEEVSRESSWRYSSLRPVTAPPLPGQHLIDLPMTEGWREEAARARTERDALARALAAERARAAAAARAHDARLAELHGVIAELVRRRQADAHAAAIPEEELSDECESTTAPAGARDADAAADTDAAAETDPDRTDQNDTSSALSPASPEPATPPRSLPEDSSAGEDHGPPSAAAGLCLSEPDSELCLTTARWCVTARARPAAGPLTAPAPAPAQAGCGCACGATRRGKLATRVRLRPAARSADPVDPDDMDVNQQECERAPWWSSREARGLGGVDCNSHGDESGCGGAGGCCAVLGALAAECRALEAARARAADTAHRLSSALAVQESSCVALCLALEAADRALELYDVLLALAETQPRAPHHPDPRQRLAAEVVARRVLARLETGAVPALGAPLLPPGPWLQPPTQPKADTGASVAWGAAHERRLRAHAARLKAATVALRAAHPPPSLFSCHDAPAPGAGLAAAQGALCDQEAAAEARLSHPYDVYDLHDALPRPRDVNDLHEASPQPYDMHDLHVESPHPYDVQDRSPQPYDEHDPHDASPHPYDRHDLQDGFPHLEYTRGINNQHYQARPAHAETEL